MKIFCKGGKKNYEIDGRRKPDASQQNGFKKQNKTKKKKKKGTRKYDLYIVFYDSEVFFG